MTDAAFRALADPVRRRILELLQRRPLAVKAIAAGFPVSRPAISRHLRLLLEAGLVEEEKAGRSRIYSLREEGLTAVLAWTGGLAAAGVARPSAESASKPARRGIARPTAEAEAPSPAGRERPRRAAVPAHGPDDWRAW